MKFDIVTLFPNFFESPLSESLISKAIKNQKFELKVHNLRDFSDHKNNQVDDTPYGGGPGMVLMADVLAKAVTKLKTSNSLVILTDPSGKKFTQTMAKELSKKQHLILICGRYEGVDQRFKDKYVDLEISIGDYVLNGGEAASLVIFETIARLLPGVIGQENSLIEESFSSQNLPNLGEVALLEYPQYTKPADFEGEVVPEILLSGDHQRIAQWRSEKALEKTKKLRPDLLKKEEK